MDEPEKICSQEFKKRGKFSRFTITGPVDLIRQANRLTSVNPRLPRYPAVGGITGLIRVLIGVNRRSYAVSFLRQRNSREQTDV